MLFFFSPFKIADYSFLLNSIFSYSFSVIYLHILKYMHMRIPRNRCYRDKMGRGGGRKESEVGGLVIFVLFAFLVVMETKS